MNSKKALDILFSGPVGYTLNEYNEASNVIYKSLERLEALKKENKEIEELYLNENKHWCETIDSLRKENEDLKEKLNGIPPEYDGYLYFAQGISNIVKENEKLKKALDEACKMLSWDCPCGQDLIDDLDCENRCQPDIDYSECWMKYFIKEVLGND